MRLIFASNNQNKIREIREILGEEFKDFVFSVKDIGVYANPEENGKDFMQNADIKVKAFYNEMKNNKLLKCGDYIISDDTGLCIEALNGAPGIYSSRFMGKETEQADKNRKIIELMKNMPKEKRNAYFITVISVIEVKNEENLLNIEQILHFEGRIDGKIAETIDGTAGFGYDPIFEVNGVTYSKMGENGKNSISHRSIALAKFVDYLEKNHNI